KPSPSAFAPWWRSAFPTPGCPSPSASAPASPSRPRLWRRSCSEPMTPSTPPSGTAATACTSRPRRSLAENPDRAVPRRDKARGGGYNPPLLSQASPQGHLPRRIGQAPHLCDHLPPRRGQDHHHREVAAVRATDPGGGDRQGQEERPPRHLRLDGHGEGAGYLCDLVGDAVPLPGSRGEPAGHPRPRGLFRGYLPHSHGG